MCVVALAWNTHARWRLLLIGNRDEAYARPSAPLAHWADAPEILAGRDLEAGGTWMGVRESGRVAVVTNVRDPRAAHDRASRGLLVSDFLRGGDPASQHATALAVDAARYRPFNLLLFDRESACFVSNHPRVRATRTSNRCSPRLPMKHPRRMPNCRTRASASNSNGGCRRHSCAARSMARARPR